MLLCFFLKVSLVVIWAWIESCLKCKISDWLRLSNVYFIDNWTFPNCSFSVIILSIFNLQSLEEELENLKSEKNQTETKYNEIEETQKATLVQVKVWVFSNGVLCNIKDLLTEHIFHWKCCFRNHNKITIRTWVHFHQHSIIRSGGDLYRLQWNCALERHSLGFMSSQITNLCI